MSAFAGCGQNGTTFSEWQAAGNGFTPNVYVNSVASGWTLAATGDFTGNGMDDLLWFNNGTFTIWDSTGNGFTPNSFVGSVTAGWTLAGTGDYNGTGMDDLLWRNTTTGAFTEWQSTGNGFTPNVVVNSSVATSWTLRARRTCIRETDRQRLLHRLDPQSDGRSPVWVFLLSAWPEGSKFRVRLYRVEFSHSQGQNPNGL